MLRCDGVAKRAFVIQNMVVDGLLSIIVHRLGTSEPFPLVVVNISFSAVVLVVRNMPLCTGWLQQLCPPPMSSIVYHTSY